MAKVYKIWTVIEMIDEDEGEFENLDDTTRGVYEEFNSLEEAVAYQESILGE
jgi:hypothetical protein